MSSERTCREPIKIGLCLHIQLYCFHLDLQGVHSNDDPTGAATTVYRVVAVFSFGCRRHDELGDQVVGEVEIGS